jgi:hypothetical protein
MSKTAGCPMREKAIKPGILASTKKTLLKKWFALLFWPAPGHAIPVSIAIDTV